MVCTLCGTPSTLGLSSFPLCLLLFGKEPCGFLFLFSFSLFPRHFYDFNSWILLSRFAKGFQRLLLDFRDVFGETFCLLEETRFVRDTKRCSESIRGEARAKFEFSLTLSIDFVPEIIYLGKKKIFKRQGIIILYIRSIFLYRHNNKYRRRVAGIRTRITYRGLFRTI